MAFTIPFVTSLWRHVKWPNCLSGIFFSIFQRTSETQISLLQLPGRKVKHGPPSESPFRQPPAFRTWRKEGQTISHQENVWNRIRSRILWISRSGSTQDGEWGWGRGLANRFATDSEYDPGGWNRPLSTREKEDTATKSNPPSNQEERSRSEERNKEKERKK